MKLLRGYPYAEQLLGKPIQMGHMRFNVDHVNITPLATYVSWSRIQIRMALLNCYTSVEISWQCLLSLRVATVREIYLENEIFSRSGIFEDGQGNLERTWKVREFENKWLWQADF